MQKLRVLAPVLVCLSLGRASADTSFGAGSIIIPATATYQTDCGSVSVYGFVYNILRANAYLEANKTVLGIPGKIEVYYTYKDNKSSPNRCTPTNNHKGPAYPGKSSPAHDDVKWNDGCDFSVFSSSGTPVKKITNSTATNTTTDATFSTVATDDSTHKSTSSGRATYPNWPSKSVNSTTTTIRYWGGSFVINDQDAPTVRKLIQGTLIAKDADNNNIDFSGFKSSSCTYGTTVGGQINLHAAQVAFTAPTPRILSTKPPRLALLGRNANQNPSDGEGHFSCNNGVGGSQCRGSNSKTGRVADNILESYLARAGLTFNGAQGCALSGYLSTNHPSLCPSPNRTGQIYDLLDFRDLLGSSLASSKLGATSGGQPLYKMFWAPHWEFIGSSPNSDEKQALTNIASFGDGQAGIMAECASISALEGAASTPTMTSFSVSQLMTCSSGTCANISTGLTVNSNPNSSTSAGPFSTDSLRNCTDPDLANGQPCAYFAYPGDGFAQTGDYRFNALQSEPSTVADFKPASGAKYRPGVLPLISGVASLDNTKLTSAATVRTMSGFKGEFVTRAYKDNNPAKSNIIYLGLHDETTSIAGTKIALQTLLLLGDPEPTPTTREVTRASPIVATIGTTTPLSVMVQGSYESITPAPTTKTATTDGEVSSFEFPYLIGHLRAIKTGSIGTQEVDFNALPSSAVAFDGGANIPPATASGCGSNFAGTCRTVFTHTTGGQRPTMRFVKTSGADFTAIKDLIAPGLTAQSTVVSRILAGIPNGSGGYTSKLGGIDRSTAAVIGSSNLVAGGTTRPQMIYVGATDGMLHAFCAKAVAGTGCNVDGRELWAFIPRVNLGKLRKNTARIDGSPRVIDMFGDFDPTDGVTARSFRTILLFQTGSGDAGVSGETPAVYALDVTDPFNPAILWEYTTPSTRGTTDFGQGITVTAGRTKIGSTIKNVAFVQTNNGGTGGAGSVVSAIDVETGLLLWQHGYLYPAARVAANGNVPAAGIPGGAVPVDRTAGGTITDVVFGTLYGDIFRLDATTGENRYGTSPLFRFSQDKKPFGAAPTVYSNGDSTNLYVANTSGGYFDPFALAQWSDSPHHIVGFAINTSAENVPLNQASSGVAFDVQLATGEKGFSQAVVVGTQLFVTTDTTDVNSSTFGNADTGKLHRLDLVNGGNHSSVGISGGGGSIAYSGTTLYMASGAGLGQILTGANNANNASTNANTVAKLARRLWLKGS